MILPCVKCANTKNTNKKYMNTACIRILHRHPSQTGPSASRFRILYLCLYLYPSLLEKLALVSLWKTHSCNSLATHPSMSRVWLVFFWRSWWLIHDIFEKWKCLFMMILMTDSIKLNHPDSCSGNVQCALSSELHMCHFSSLWLIIWRCKQGRINSYFPRKRQALLYLGLEKNRQKKPYPKKD